VFRQTTTHGIATTGKKATRGVPSTRDPLQPLAGRVTKVDSVRNRTRRAAGVGK
jgi:hypothetical protein